MASQPRLETSLTPLRKPTISDKQLCNNTRVMRHENCSVQVRKAVNAKNGMRNIILSCYIYNVKQSMPPPLPNLTYDPDLDNQNFYFFFSFFQI